MDGINENHVQVLPHMRESLMYGLCLGRTVVRYDVMWPGEILSFDQVIKGDVTEHKKQKARDVAVKLLAKEMRSRGISPADLIRIPSH